MFLFYLFSLAICLWGLKYNKNGFIEDYLGRSQTSAIKGVFLLLVFASHMCSYLMKFRITYESFEKIPIYCNAWLGQLIVVMFFFYSGFGIIEQFRKRGAEYVKTIPIKRIVNVLANFGIAVTFYLVYNILFGIENGVAKVLLSFIGWESLGNSNWYIFAILVCYLLIYIGLMFFARQIVLFAFLAVTLAAVAISLFKPTWWYDTMLAFPLGIMYAVHRNRFENFVRQHYRCVLIFCVGLFFFIRSVPLDYVGLKHNIQSIIFAVIVVLLTMKFSIRNKTLIWIGVNLFPLYIYQRLPMLAFERLLGEEYVRGHVTLYVALCVVVTALFAFAYQYFKLDFSRVRQ